MRIIYVSEIGTMEKIDKANKCSFIDLYTTTTYSLL